MSSPDYRAYYTSQMGGEIRVFRGGLQTGAGLGDILRGVFRFIAPIALRGVSAFATNTLAGTQAGLPLALAARAALGPTISAVAGGVIPSMQRFVNAVAPGIVPGRPPVQKPAPAPAPRVTVPLQDTPLGLGYGPSTPEPQKGKGVQPVLFEGVDGVPVTSKGVHQYKRDMKELVGAVVKHKAQKRKQPSLNAIHYNF